MTSNILGAFSYLHQHLKQSEAGIDFVSIMKRPEHINFRLQTVYKQICYAHISWMWPTLSVFILMTMIPEFTLSGNYQPLTKKICSSPIYLNLDGQNARGNPSIKAKINTPSPHTKCRYIWCVNFGCHSTRLSLLLLSCTWPRELSSEQATERERAGEERQRWKVERQKRYFLIVEQWIKCLCLKSVEADTLTFSLIFFLCISPSNW